jgi:hypothetical protein
MPRSAFSRRESQTPYVVSYIFCDPQYLSNFNHGNGIFTAASSLLLCRTGTAISDSSPYGSFTYTPHTGSAPRGRLRLHRPRDWTPCLHFNPFPRFLSDALDLASPFCFGAGLRAAHLARGVAPTSGPTDYRAVTQVASGYLWLVSGLRVRDRCPGRPGGFSSLIAQPFRTGTGPARPYCADGYFALILPAQSSSD